jgi:hypothetical protein
MSRGPNPIEVILSDQEVQALEKCIRRHRVHFSLVQSSILPQGIELITENS